MSFTKDSIEFQPLPTGPKFVDLTTRTFDRLTVIGYAGKTSGGQSQWWCQCLCGKIKSVRGPQLTSGRTRSCGCLFIETVSAQFTTHGDAKGYRYSPELRVYNHAKGRCQNPKDGAYSNYGGRGIEFRFTSFPQFLQEVGRRPSPDHSIDRIDNDGHYEAGNLRWATRVEQSRNRRATKIVRIGNEQYPLAAVCPDKTSRSRFYDRRERGWCEECAVVQPVDGQCVHH